MKFAAVFYTTVVSFLFLFDTTTACRAEVCRRRRGVSQKSVMLNLQGCGGESLPWVQKLAFCLNLNVVDTSFRIMDWYQQAFETCSSTCASVIQQETDSDDEIRTCVDCFLAVPGLDDVIASMDVTIPTVRRCVEQYVYADLNPETPRVVARSEGRGAVILPEKYNVNKWFSVTVKLPCKPPVFKFWNSMCINAFTDEDTGTDNYVIAQNRLMKKADVEFYVEFGNGCHFDVGDIEILWDKSVPGFALPQISGFSGRKKDEELGGDEVEAGQMFFDAQSFQKLLKTNPRELELLEENKLFNFKSSIATKLAMSQHQIGIEFPCEVKSFQITDHNKFPAVVASNGRRHLISKIALTAQSKGKKKLIYQPTLLNFLIDYGKAEDGEELCSFEASQIQPIIDPDEDWFNSTSTNTTDRVNCLECTGATSEKDCARSGVQRQCNVGEVCLKETRQLSPTRVSITSMCHDEWACPSRNPSIKVPGNCNPGKRGSICWCCCSEGSCSDSSQCL